MILTIQSIFTAQRPDLLFLCELVQQLDQLGFIDGPCQLGPDVDVIRTGFHRDRLEERREIYVVFFRTVYEGGTQGSTCRDRPLYLGDTL